MDTKMDKRNIIIIVLIVLLGLCFLWGAWGNQYHKIYRADLHAAGEKIAALELSSQKVDAITVRATELQDLVQVQEQQLGGLKEELMAIDRLRHDLEAKLVKQEASLSEQIAEKDALLAEFKRNSEAYTADLQKQLTEKKQVLLKKEQLLTQFHQKCEEAILQAVAEQEKNITGIKEAQMNRQELVVDIERGVELEESANRCCEAVTTAKDIAMLRAQIIGLEKIVEKRNNVVEELNNTLEIIRINRDVLLEKIGDQNYALRELREENRALIRGLTDKDKQIADLHEELQVYP